MGTAKPFPTLTAGSWDVHVHAVPAELRRLADTNLFDMRADGGAIWIRNQRLLLGKMLGGEGIQRDRASMADHLALSIPPALVRYDLDADETRQWTSLVNGGMEEICGVVQRTYAFAYLPLHEPEQAVREIELRRGSPWIGFVIGTTVGERLLDDEKLRPVYDALNKMSAFVFVHPLQSPDKRLNAYYLENLLGNPTETGLAVAALLFSGKLSEFPNIQFCFAHGGGVTPHLIGRWQHGYDTSRPGIRKLPVPPVDAVRNLYVDSIVHDAGAFEQCLRTFGETHVLPGSDYPFPMGEKLGHAAFQLVSNDIRNAVIYQNVPNLLALCGLQMEAKKNR